MDSLTLSVQRGDIVLVVASGDYGKPRPAVIVQSDLFNDTHASLTICPVTSSLVEVPLFRVPLKPSRANGLARQSKSWSTRSRHCAAIASASALAQ